MSAAPLYPNFIPSAPAAHEDGLQSINWEAHKLKYRNFKPSKTENAYIMRPVGLALAGLAYVFGKVTVSVALTMTATPWVVLGSTVALSLITLTTALIGVELLFLRTYNYHTSETMLKKERAIAEELRHTDDSWWEITNKHPDINKFFDKEELDLLYFRNQAQGCTAKAFIEKVGLYRLKYAPLTALRLEELRNKFANELAQEGKGLAELKRIYSAELKVLTCLDDVWLQIRDREIARGYNALIIGNGVDVIERLNPTELKLVGNSFIKETLERMQKIQGYQKDMDTAKRLGVEAEYREALSSWFKGDRSKRGLTNLKDVVTHYGLEVVDPIFLGSAAEEILQFVNSCDPFQDKQILFEFIKKKMLTPKGLDEARARALQACASLQVGANQLLYQHSNLLRLLQINLRTLMPSIQSHEVSLGYAQFVARNSSEAFEFICEDSKKALRDSFLNQIVPMNLDAETPIPYKGEVLGINAGDINRCRRGWFEREFAKLNAPTMQQLVHKFGNSVVASYYLPPESDETKAIVYRTLGSLDFQADSALLSRLISLQYLDEKQVAAVEFVKKQHAEIHKKTESLFSDIVVEDRRQRAAVEESYGLIFANHRCLEREAEIEQEGRLRPILVLFEQSKGLVRSLEELATAAQSKYDGVSSALPRLQSRAKDLSVEIQRLNRELKSNITHSAQVQIAEIDKQLARFPSGTVSVADRIQFLKLELEHMQKKEQLVRYNITDIASKRAQLEKNRSAMGDDADATLDSLETRRKEAAKVTGVGNAVKALMPGSQYNEEMNSIIHKIQLKNEQLKIEGDIAVLEAQPKISAEERQQKTTYENELRDLQDQEAKMVEKVGLQNKKAAQEKIIAEYQSLPVMINIRVCELNHVESQIATSSLQLREMARRLDEANNNVSNAKNQQSRNEAMLKEAKEAYKRKATELHLKRKELEKNQEREFSQLKEKKAQMIDQVNKQCAMEIQAVSDAFNARYKA